MSASTIIDKCTHEQIQSAQAVALLRLKNAHKYSLAQIGTVIGCCKQSVSQYIISDTEMSAASWLKAVSHWPELNDMMLAELDEAEKALVARQRALNLKGGQ